MNKVKPLARKVEIENFTMPIAKPAFEELQAAALRRGVTVTEFVRQAIGTENLLQEEAAKGARIFVKHPKKGQSKQLLFR